jgi:hypothetical protein
MTRPAALAFTLLAAAALAVAPGVRADGPSPAGQRDRAPVDKDKAKEKDKDKKDKDGKPASPAPRRVFTEDDLKKYSEERAKGRSEGEETPAAPAPDPNAPSDMPDSSQEHGGRALWATRASAARDLVAEAEGKIAAIEGRITALRNDMEPGREMEPFRLQRIEADIAKAMAELEQARKELAKAQAAQEELFQEARRLGVPSGWLREP